MWLLCTLIRTPLQLESPLPLCTLIRIPVPSIQVFHAGEKILDRQRFQFPPNWVYVDHVDGEWGAFNEIMKRKDLAVQGQVGSLQMKIVAEDKVVEQRTQALLQEWEREKPIQVRGEGRRGEQKRGNFIQVLRGGKVQAHL